MKKIVVISYYFPPSAKAGAHRPYSMAEYLPKFQWTPIFVAPENPYYGRLPRFDSQLLESVKHFPIYRVNGFYPCNNSSASIAARAIRKIWEKLWFPDTRVVWNHFVKKCLPAIYHEHRPDAFFISATPFSSFLLAPYLKKHYGIPVVIDYRDPWTSNPYVNSGANAFNNAIAKRMEKKVVGSADLITTASFHMTQYIQEHWGSEMPKKPFFSFPYGFDKQFFDNEIIQPQKPSSKITATFAGSVHGGGCAYAEEILAGIQQAIAMNSEVAEKLQVCCYGTLFGNTKNNSQLVAKYQLQNHIQILPFLPYREFLDVLQNSSFLILPQGNNFLANVLYPTKFFDYLGVRRPILGIADEGQVAETIQKCQAGICCPPQKQKIAESVGEICQKAHQPQWYNDFVNTLDRQHIFAELCHLLDELATTNAG